MKKLVLFIFMLSFTLSVFAWQIDKYISEFNKTSSVDFDSVNTLIENWNIKAEYIYANDYTKEVDKIKITVNWKSKTFPWVYTEKERKIYLSKISKWECLDDKWEKISPFNAMCMVSEEFWWFVRFSPSWYYLEYKRKWFEYSWINLLDLNNWKKILDINFPSFSSWTLDKKQFIYAQWSEFSWEKWLFITIKWSFPKSKILIDDFIDSWYVDSKYIYVKTHKYIKNVEVKYNKVIDLKTLKVIYSKKI